MKSNFKKFAVAIAAIMTIGSVALVSCDKVDDNITKPFHQADKKYVEHVDYGALHNEMLLNVENQYDTTMLFSTVGDVLDYVDSINKCYLQKSNIPEALNIDVMKAIHNNRGSMSYADFYDSIFDGQYSVFNSNKILMDYGVVNQTEYEHINDIAQLMFNTCTGKISHENSLQELHSILQKANKTEHTQVGEVLFSIMEHSYDYWENEGNEPTMPYDYALPPQVYADAAGAVVGGALAAGAEYAMHGTVSTGNVVAGAVTNAIDASTGMTTAVANGVVKAAKVAGKFIKKLF